MKKAPILFLITLFISKFVLSQDNSINVIANGSGTNEKEATNAALRNSIEKAFGVFISISTEVQNDQLVKDKITSIAQGTVKNYKIISAINDGKDVTVLAEIVPTKIVEAIKTQGYDIKLNGSVYAQNALKEEYYKNQEPTVFKDFFAKYEQSSFFDFRFIVSTPKNFKVGQTDLYTLEENLKLAIDSCYEEMANIYRLRKRDFIDPVIAKSLPWRTFFPSLGGEKYAGNIFWKYGNVWENNPNPGYPPSDELVRRSANENIQIIQIVCIPHINSNYIEFVKSLLALLKAVNIIDVQGFENTSGKTVKINVNNLNKIMKDIEDQSFSLRNEKVLPIISNFFEKVYLSSTILNVDTDFLVGSNEAYAELPSFHYRNLNSNQLTTFGYSGLELGPFIRKEYFRNNVSEKFFAITFTPSRAFLFFDLNNLSKLNDIKLISKPTLFKIGNEE
jgi:hypothetical protein